jgi:hypothetical protein
MGGKREGGRRKQLFLERTEEVYEQLLSGEPLKKCTKRAPPKGKQKNRSLGTKRAMSFSRARSPFLPHQDCSGCVCMNAITIESDREGVYDMEIEGRTSIKREDKGKEARYSTCPTPALWPQGRQADRQADRRADARTVEHGICLKER